MGSELRVCPMTISCVVVEQFAGMIYFLKYDTSMSFPYINKDF